MRLYINGRFATRPMTGVDRVACELTAELRQIATELPKDMLVLHVLLPRCSPNQFLALSNSTLGEAKSVSKLTGLLWEQFLLPFQAADGWAINLCNVGPIIGRRQILMIHDAQIYISPKSYSFCFRTWYRVAQPLLARRASLLFTVSDYSKNKLEEECVFPRRKAQVIPNGVDHMNRISADDSILERHQLSSQNYFLAMGSASKHKNLICVLNAIAACSSEAPRLVIAGGNVSEIKAAFASSISERVLLLGRVSDEELKALYIHSKAFLFPSITEGFGLPPLEAMYCGCPVLASTSGAISEVCGDTVRYVDPDKPEDWAVAMEELASDPDVREKISARACDRAAKFTWRRAAMQLLQTIASLEDNSSLKAQLEALNAS